MGFGFNLLLIFVLVPLTAILLIVWAVTKKNIFGKALGIIWLAIIGLAIVSGITQKLNAKILLEKKDFYGQYIVDKSFFPGKQSDWQYKHLWFDIKNDDSIYFYAIDDTNNLTTYKGIITTIKRFSSERLNIHMIKPTHHILTSNPTIYRDTKSFYLVFNSPKFGNVFFKKGNWTQIDK
jgi:hypothetical protein